jgi:hypothetical protein
MAETCWQPAQVNGPALQECLQSYISNVHCMIVVEVCLADPRDSQLRQGLAQDLWMCWRVLFGPVEFALQSEALICETVLFSSLSICGVFF